MNIIYNGTDIYNDVDLTYCVYETFSERQADTLTLRFKDEDGIWNRWNPQSEDEVQLIEGSCDTGIMFVHSTASENDAFTIRSLSLPQSKSLTRTQAWEGVRFLQIGNLIAQKHGLTFKNFGCKDQVYPYLKQENENDFSFYSGLCTLEGYQMIVYNEQLIVYDEAEKDSGLPEYSLDIVDNNAFAYNKRNTQYGCCEVSAGGYRGKYDIGDTGGLTLRPNSISDVEARVPGLALSKNRANIQCSSDAEAARFAKGLLRYVNKYSCIGRFTTDLMTGYAAASVINITNTLANLQNEAVFIYKIRHDFVNAKSTFYFRKVLEGY